MAVEKVNSSSSLAEVIDRILDKGIVVDAWVRVSLVGSSCWPLKRASSWLRWRPT